MCVVIDAPFPSLASCNLQCKAMHHQHAGGRARASSIGMGACMQMNVLLCGGQHTQEERTSRPSPVVRPDGVCCPCCPKHPVLPKEQRTVQDMQGRGGAPSTSVMPLVIHLYCFTVILLQDPEAFFSASRARLQLALNDNHTRFSCKPEPCQSLEYIATHRLISTSHKMPAAESSNVCIPGRATGGRYNFGLQETVVRVEVLDKVRAACMKYPRSGQLVHRTGCMCALVHGPTGARRRERLHCSCVHAWRCGCR